MPGLIEVKDNNSVYQRIGNDACKLLGIRSPEMSEGITDYDLTCPASESADKFIQDDHRIILSGQKMATIEIQQYSDGWNGLVSERTTIRDSHQTICGLFIQCIDISQTMLFYNFLYLLEMDRKRQFAAKPGQSYLLTQSHAPFALTNRQEEILFYTIRGRTPKEIGKVLGLSYRTVESYQDSIKNKLACDSKAQLIEKALDAGYLWYVPHHMMQNSFKTILK